MLHCLRPVLCIGSTCVAQPTNPIYSHSLEGCALLMTHLLGDSSSPLELYSHHPSKSCTSPPASTLSSQVQFWWPMLSHVQHPQGTLNQLPPIEQGFFIPGIESKATRLSLNSCSILHQASCPSYWIPPQTHHLHSP